MSAHLLPLLLATLTSPTASPTPPPPPSSTGPARAGQEAQRSVSVHSAREEEAEPLYRVALKVALSRQGAAPEAVLAALTAALEAGACPTRALTEEAFARLHTEPRFRELIRLHAHQSTSVLVTPGEPGQPLSITGRVLDARGAPLPGALVYVFHTDARGEYGPPGAGESNPRLFGYLRTDAEGRFGFRTIRPGAYPDTTEPVEQHIHVEASAPGHALLRWRIGFADDPFWHGRTPPAWALPVERDADGLERCQLELALRPEPPAER